MVKYCISWIGILCWAVAVADASSERLPVCSDRQLEPVLIELSSDGGGYENHPRSGRSWTVCPNNQLKIPNQFWRCPNAQKGAWPVLNGSERSRTDCPNKPNVLETAKLRRDSNSSSLHMCGCFPRSIYSNHHRLSKYLHGGNPSDWLSLFNSLSGHMTGRQPDIELTLAHLRIFIDVITRIAKSSLQHLSYGIRSGQVGPKETQEALYKLTQLWIRVPHLWWRSVMNLTNGSLHNFGSQMKSWASEGGSLLENSFTQPSGLNLSIGSGIIDDWGQYVSIPADKNHSWSFGYSLKEGEKFNRSFWNFGLNRWSDFDNLSLPDPDAPGNIKGWVPGVNIWSNEPESSNWSSSSSESGSDSESAPSDKRNKSSKKQKKYKRYT